MEKQHTPLSAWQERLFTWSGWEKIGLYRKQLIIALISLIFIIWMLGFAFSRSEKSSTVALFQAQNLVQKFQENQLDKQTAEQNLTQLELLAPIGSDLSKRFSGYIAQEQLIQGSPFEKARIETSKKVLRTNNLDLYEQLNQICQWQKEEDSEKALSALADVLEKSEDTPYVHFYALLMQAALLQKAHIDNSTSIEQARAQLQASPEVRLLFESWDLGNEDDFFKSLTTLS